MTTVVTTIDEQIVEVTKTQMSAHSAAAQAKVLSMRLAAKGDVRGSDIARQVANKLRDIITLLGREIDDLTIRKQMLVDMAVSRLDTEFHVITWADEDDYRQSQEDAHVLMEEQS